ncbi:hypothetical protein GOP47_0003084 [Adiantum capillus-veneris]|uniref:Pectinesterase inhibitor domain-containing protein n=1 Tax=Adiantum capillus-veneris TaxID=13818 RepID=A0A9D4VBB1_ADICA|nr:hypothetical protein GOP47_0003084 [Adiantum capillus-veneris]
MVTSPSPCPPPTEVVYSKIGAASFSSLEYSSGLLAHRNGHKSDLSRPPLIAPSTAPVPPLPESPPTQPPSPSASVQAQSLSSLCSTTEQAELCLKTLSTFPSLQTTVSLQDLTAFVVKTALGRTNETYTLALNLSRSGDGSGSEKAVVQDCLDLLDQARDELHDCIDSLSHLDPHGDAKVVQGQVMNVRVWMSSSYTDQDTCWDGFEDVEGPVKDQLLKSGQPIAPLISMALSFANVLQQVGLSTLYALHQSPP